MREDCAWLRFCSHNVTQGVCPECEHYTPLKEISKVYTELLFTESQSKKLKEIKKEIVEIKKLLEEKLINATN
jgi:hypothetical protein